MREIADETYHERIISQAQLKFEKYLVWNNLLVDF